ncbi:hypothetical protein ASE03_31025 [Kitasatospora sp. Root187]|nr:hypothetical protein ASC99_16445 [Kitasatospora sp. Root107]KRB66027.1 hypothetical protein ASE03_31025 [Kitasatospora sp. Root187]
MIRRLMFVEHPIGTHLSESSTPGGKSPLARNDDNGLVTQAVLYAADNEIKLAVGLIFAAGVGVTLAGVKAAPHVKSKFNDLKSKLSRKSEEAVGVAAQESNLEQSDLRTTS